MPEAALVGVYRANALFDTHREDPKFGHRLSDDEAEASDQLGADRAAGRICPANQWFSVFGKHKSRVTTIRPGPAFCGDLLLRDFTADRPKQLWLTDITEHHTAWIPAIVATPALLTLFQ